MFVQFAGEQESLKMPKIWKPELLLLSNIPKPLHQVNPRTILGSSWWNATRKAAYASTNFHCLACGVHKTKAKYHQWLEGHEVYEINYKAGTSTYRYTAPLCHFCHNFIHDGRLENLLQQGKIHHHKYAAILKHGSEILKRAKLTKESRAERERKFALLETKGEVAAWSEWRLILNDVAYPPKFKSLEEWKKAMAPEELNPNRFVTLAQYLELDLED